MKLLFERFLEKIERKDSCWIWKSKVNKKTGYGQFYFRGKDFSAHRVSWILFEGEIPVNKFICHTCDNRLCVNPEHLWLGTHKQNMQDAVNKHRFNSLKFHEKSKKVLNEKLVLELRELYRNPYDSYQLAKLYNLNRGTVYAAIKGYNWKHLPIKKYESNKIKINKKHYNWIVISINKESRNYTVSCEDCLIKKTISMGNFRRMKKCLCPIKNTKLNIKDN